MAGDPPPVGRIAPAAPAASLIDRRFRLLATAVLALAAFNLFFRLGQEFVSEWDESLYAITASEALNQGHWIGTTFLGALDYYNSKPPLNIWLIASAFKLFGTSLFALRLASGLSAWLTVAVLMGWTRRVFGAGVALSAGIILATSFGFVQVHSGRSANTDALFTLLMLLTVVTLWASDQIPSRRIWLGPIAAAIFLLRGMAVLMPVALVASVLLARKPDPSRPRATWTTHLSTVALFAMPVGLWMLARYRVDQWTFLRPLFWYDFVARSMTVIEEHPGGPFYYLGILVKHQYDWLMAGALALALVPLSWARVRSAIGNWRTSPITVLCVAWAGVTLLIPAVMQTKVPWYLNPFYPLFATLVALLVVRGMTAEAQAPRLVRTRVLAAACVLLLAIAETKLVAYSFQYRDLRHSEQSLLLIEKHQLAGRRVYRDLLSRGSTFVARNLVGADPLDVANVDAFMQASRLGDFFMTRETVVDPKLELVRSGAGYHLYRRCDPQQRQARAGY